MPAVTTTAAMETTATETSVKTKARETGAETPRETAVKAPTMKASVETTMMKNIMMMKEPKPERYGNAVGIIRE